MKKIIIIITAAVFVITAVLAITIHKRDISTSVDNKPKQGVTRETINIDKKPVIYNENPVPVLMYHSIDYEKGNELRVPKEKFQQQMKYLKDNNYTTLTLVELYSFFQENKPIPKKSVIITFDDGYEDNYTNAYPVLKKYGFNAVVFIITSTIDKNNKCLNSSQLKEMGNNGIDVESHTANHEELNRLSYEKQLETLKESKQVLEGILNKQVYYLAYPVGKWNNDSIEALKSSGYKMAFTTKNGWANKSNGIYTLNRVRINASYTLEQFKKLVEYKN